MTIYEKMLELQREISYAKKDSRNLHFKYNYVSESALVEKVMPIFNAKGLIVIANLVDLDVFDMQEKPSAKVIYEYTLREVETGEEIVIRAAGFEQGDKCAFKAMTGANKYFWLRLLQIATGDDPEKEESVKEPSPQKDTYHQAAGPKVNTPQQQEDFKEQKKALRDKIVEKRDYVGLTKEQGVILMGGELTLRNSVSELEAGLAALQSYEYRLTHAKQTDRDKEIMQFYPEPEAPEKEGVTE